MSMEMVLIACIVLIIVLLIFIVVALLLGGSGAAPQAATMVPATASAMGVAPSLTPTVSVPTVVPTFPVRPDGRVRLTVETTEHVWIRVTVDEATVFQDILSPGEPRTWYGRDEVMVETGNGAGVVVTVNEQLQGTMCGRGERCARAWGPDGELGAS